MSNNQISQLALVLSDLSYIGHVNSSINFINMSGKNYINVMIEGTVATIDGDKVTVFNQAQQMSFDSFISKIADISVV